MKIISKRGRESATKQSSAPLNKQQIIEMIKCAGDPLYFIEKYIRVESPSGPRNLMMQLHHQEFITTMHSTPHVIAMMPRQAGMTTMSLAFVLWEALFQQNHRAAIFAVNHRMVQDLFVKLNFMLTHIPAYLRPAIKQATVNCLQFDNNTTITVDVCTPNSMRGRTINRLYFDQFAMLPDNMQQVMLQDMTPTLAMGGKVLIGSTPKGNKNTFAQLWKNSFSSSNTFVPFKRTVDDLGFTNGWKQVTKNSVGEIVWLQEYMCEFIT